MRPHSYCEECTRNVHVTVLQCMQLHICKSVQKMLCDKPLQTEASRGRKSESQQLNFSRHSIYNNFQHKYTVFQKSNAKIKITITTAHLIRINYPLSSFNYRLSGTNVANFNKIHHMVSEQQLFKKKELKNRIFQYVKYRLTYLLQKVLRIEFEVVITDR